MDVLNGLIRGVLTDVAAREAAFPLEDVKRRARHVPEARDAFAALAGSPGATAVIAEIKRSSPATGPLAAIPDPAALARAYEDGGAALISVVTERRGYDGSVDDLTAVCRAVSVPVLRKDFVMTSYQVHESRAYGADVVLLVAAALEQPALVSLLERIHSLGMCALVETHSRLDALRALDAGARMIGVNARDLTTGVVERDVVDQVIDVIPPDVSAVAESGVRSPRGVFSYAKSGADAVLVGEALVCSPVPRDLVSDMVSAGHHPALLTDRRARIRAAYAQRHHEVPGGGLSGELSRS